MKKIVALVLSLVMVLGLATTAMAATGGVSLNDALAATNTDTVELKAGLTASTSLKTFDTYQVFVTDKDKNVSVLPDQYVKVPSATRATYFVVDGTKITYLAVNPTAAYTDVAKAVTVAYNADPECGDVYVANEDEAGTYYLYKNAYYKEVATGSTVLFNVDGMAVWADAAPEVLTFAHDYEADYAQVAGKTTITKVYCDECKASFAFVEGTAADAVAKFGAGKYLPTTVTPAGAQTNTVYVALVASAPATEGDKVESAETFDAGIAMYVGMSVMAAAGSAVVLKKKD